MIKIRMDDLDTRIKLEILKPAHEEFVKRGIPMTVAVNNMMGHDYKIPQEILDYVNNTDPKTWDIQLHGLTHERMWTYNKSEMYRDIWCNLTLTKRDFIHSNPTIFYPPWNQTSKIMENICKELGLTVVVSSKTIREFLLDWAIENETMFYWHWQTPDDVEMLPKVLDKILQLEKGGQNGTIL